MSGIPYVKNGSITIDDIFYLSAADMSKILKNILSEMQAANAEEFKEKFYVPIDVFETTMDELQDTITKFSNEIENLKTKVSDLKQLPEDDE